jgi:hypothetical protein
MLLSKRLDVRSSDHMPPLSFHQASMRRCQCNRPTARYPGRLNAVNLDCSFHSPETGFEEVRRPQCHCTIQSFPKSTQTSMGDRK